ncbi:MAG: AAC(3) family N-acetyltransferase [Acidobacteria bacterium]|nr:AAC(3) family N-acetyltransferase [Acidobacteriota bacterium]
MTFSLDDIKAALREVIHAQDEVILVYSGLFQFGSGFDGPLSRLPDQLLDAMDEIVGPERTLLLPTHTGSFPRTRAYDPVRTKAETGVVADAFCRRPGAVRTLCPMDSYAVKGPRVDEVVGRPVSTLWGDDSVMAWLEEVDARICVIGVPWKYCGYHHRVEEVLQIPFRYYKTFHGTLTVNGMVPRPVQSTAYVRSLELPPIYHTDGTTDLLRQRGQIHSAADRGVPIESARAIDILTACVDSLAEDPYGWLVNRDAVRRWVEDGGRQREEAGLSLEQRYRRGRQE